MSQDSIARWQHAKAVLERVQSLPEGSRSSELDRACVGDADLKATVESLLRAREPHRDRLGRLGSALDRVLALADAPERWVGRTLGEYRISELLGSGGMGAVYRAAPSGGGPAVAIKVLRAALPSRPARKRFDLERDRLDRLSHPGIASLLGSGTAPDGEPYLVMELVEGEPIDAYSDRRRLSIRDRLELLLEVGSAVAYAHDHQIVHRDLKPSNILVRASGAPALLDFGIAKLLDPIRGGAPATLTFESLAYTPGYASPEQVAGEPVSPVSDVYSLGAVGYTLLAGGPPPTTVARRLRTPLRVFRSHETDALQGIAAARAMGVEELELELCGDLEEIMLRACDLRPQGRQPSVAAFTDEVARYLSASRDD